MAALTAGRYNPSNLLYTQAWTKPTSLGDYGTLVGQPIPTGTSTAAPTFVAAYGTATWTGTAATQTASVTTAVGDTLVLYSMSENNTRYSALSGITGGTNLTWTLQEDEHTAANLAPLQLYTATATTAETFTLSVNVGTSGTMWGFNCLRFSGVSALGAVNMSTGSGAGGATTLTGVAANSVVVTAVSDWSANTATRAWLGTVTETSYFANGTNYGVYGAYQSTASAGNLTVGLSTPNMTYVAAAIELKGTAGSSGSNWTTDASTAITTSFDVQLGWAAHTDTAMNVVGIFATTVALTTSLVAGMDVTATLGADAVVTHQGQTSTAVTTSLTADTTRTTSAGTSTTASATLSTDTVRTTTTGTSTTATATLGAASSRATNVDTATAVSATLGASAIRTTYVDATSPTSATLSAGVGTVFQVGAGLTVTANPTADTARATTALTSTALTGTLSADATRLTTGQTATSLTSTLSGTAQRDQGLSGTTALSVSLSGVGQLTTNDSSTTVLNATLAADTARVTSGGASTAITATLDADALVLHVGSAAALLDLTATSTANVHLATSTGASLATSFTGSADAQVSHQGLVGAPLDITATLGASSQRGQSTDAGLVVQVQPTADVAQGTSASLTSAFISGLNADAVIDRQLVSDLTLTAGLSADAGINILPPLTEFSTLVLTGPAGHPLTLTGPVGTLILTLSDPVGHPMHLAGPTTLVVSLSGPTGHPLHVEGPRS